MATVRDVAEYTLRKCGAMSAMKLQKLVYYAQAWSLVWDEVALYPERIEAWANGPVVWDLYALHRGKFSIAPGEIGGNPDALTPEQRETVDKVLEFYGARSAQWLIDLTHLEAPWIEARDGLAAGARGHREITHASMAEYYSAIC